MQFLKSLTLHSGDPLCQAPNALQCDFLREAEEYYLSVSPEMSAVATLNLGEFDTLQRMFIATYKQFAEEAE
jgi:hypothetical protein